MSSAQRRLRRRVRSALRVVAERVPPLRTLLLERRDLQRRVAAVEGENTAAKAQMRSLRNANERLTRANARLRRIELHRDDLLAAEVRASVGGSPLADVRYLFIVTYGRSGSTLLQGIIGSIPGYLVRGENGAALYDLYRYHSSLASAKRAHRKRGKAPNKSWYGIVDYDVPAALAGMRALVVQTLLRPEPDTRVVGFKEIRWWQDDWQEYLTFLRALFPGARFIINTRDHEAVSQSKWWATTENARELLQSYEKRLSEIADVLGDSAYRTRYDDFVADPSSLRGLFDWLGETYDPAAVEAVMAVKHSS